MSIFFMITEKSSNSFCRAGGIWTSTNKKPKRDPSWVPSKIFCYGNWWRFSLNPKRLMPCLHMQVWQRGTERKVW